MPGPASRAKRPAHVDAASSALGSADRNLFLTGGGVLSWLGGTVTWTAALKVHDFAGVAWSTAVWSLSGLAAEGDCVVLSVSRSNHAVPVAVTKMATINYTSALDVSTQDGEGIIVLAVRDALGNLVFRDGTVLPDGGRRVLGTFAPTLEVYDVATTKVGIDDYSEVLPGGGITFRDGKPDLTATKLILGLTYPVGTGMLKVYLGGRRLMVDYAPENVATVPPGHPAFEVTGPRGDYHEVDDGLDPGATRTGLGTEIQFYGGHEPQVGDKLLVVVD